MTTDNFSYSSSSTVAVGRSIGYIASGKRPNDGMFENGVSLHNYSKTAFPEKVMEITDPHLLADEEGKRFRKFSRGEP
ncbi:hypothetical protein ACSBR1_007817 [Camellia fascicularis]